MLQPLPRDVERAYKELLADTESYFSAKVKWSETGRIETAEVPTFAEQFLLRLYNLRRREAVERATYRVMTA